MPFCLVLILSIQHFNLSILGKGLIHVLATLHIQLQVHVAFLACALVVHIDALNIVEGVPLKQVVDGPLHFGVLHTPESSIADSWHLLDIAMKIRG